MNKKISLVTGADHGVGLALTEELLNRGYYVIATRFNTEECLIDKLKDRNPEQLEIVPVDIGKDESVAKMKKIVTALVPHIDLLINNAGILGDMEKVLGDELDFDEMLKVINVNALGTLRVTNALAELVLRSKDKMVVNISSEAGSIEDCNRVGWFGYCMSKAANNMQSALVHNNLKKQGGKVIAIHPGHVATYMRGHLDTTASLTPEQSAQGILQVALDEERMAGEKPEYINYKGDFLPW